MIFYVFFVSTAVIIFLQIDSVTFASKENTSYGSKLTAAAHSAVETVDAKNALDGEYLWQNREDRQAAVDTFFYAFASSMSTAADSRVQVTTPVILLVDTDGFYIGYNALFKLSNIADRSKENEFANSMQITELIPWSINKNGYSIRLYLNDTVLVTSPEGKRYKGKRRDVANALLKASEDSGVVDYLNEDIEKTANGESLGSEYSYDRTAAIVGSVQETLNKYINEYNNSAVVNGESYHIEMPEVKGEMWHRLLENPTFVAFMQGTNVNTGKTIINTYAYAGGEYIKNEKYFITDDGYYHRLKTLIEAGDVIVNSDGQYEITGHYGSYGGYTVDKLYNSMEECARHGANPCPDCIP